MEANINKTIKVLHINAGLDGGAGIAALRIHESVIRVGVNSYFLSNGKLLNQSHSLRLHIYFILVNMFLKIPVMFYRKKSKYLFSIGFFISYKNEKIIRTIQPDILHLHWVSNGSLNLKYLYKLGIPIVWTLHDLWPVTGGCHYDQECGRYTSKCGKCKILRSQSENDLSRLNFNYKKKYYQKMNINFVGISEWITSEAKKSKLANNKTVNCIPNPINISKSISRSNDLSSKNIIFFPIYNYQHDERKGYKFIPEIVNKLRGLDIIFRYIDDKPNDTLEDVIVCERVMKQNSSNSMFKLFNESKMTIFPSLQENYSNSILESLSAGTPVVAFNIGGNKDMINHLENGYLVKPYDLDDFANGIRWILNNNHNYKMSSACLNSLQKNSCEKIGQQYYKLYLEILSK